ncbi:MAG: hypothetical protein JKY45_10045 [Emcibacter sp.]|nr:hypothetical protein [Emcibacter sp.]
MTIQFLIVPLIRKKLKVESYEKLMLILWALRIFLVGSVLAQQVIR